MIRIRHLAEGDAGPCNKGDIRATNPPPIESGYQD